MTGLPATIIIHGVTIPISAVDSLSKAVPTILLGIGQKESPQFIAGQLEPTAIAVIESIAAMMFPPFGGTIVEVLIFLAANAKPFSEWTDDERQRWYDRAQGVC